MSERKLTVEEIEEIQHRSGTEWNNAALLKVLGRLCRTALAALEEAKAYAVEVEVLRVEIDQVRMSADYCAQDATRDPWKALRTISNRLRKAHSLPPGEAGARIVEKARRLAREERNC